MLTNQAIEETIAGHVLRLLRERGREAVDIQADSRLTDDLGLDSLAIASLFIALEDEFAADPFGEQFSVVDMRTVGDLARAYGAVLNQPEFS